MILHVAKDQNSRRQQEAARKRRRDARQRASDVDFKMDIFDDGWAPFTALDDTSFEVGPPPHHLLDSSRCPLAAVCDGYGARHHLRAATSAFTGAAGSWNVACAKLCASCDGRSFMTMLGPAGVQLAQERHEAHVLT